MTICLTIYGTSSCTQWSSTLVSVNATTAAIFSSPRQRKKTRYCDRVRTDNRCTCKQIGPQQIYKFRLQHIELLADYDRAINRNYRRVERYELKLGDEKQGKDLSYNDYADWLRDLHTAKVAFMSGEMSEEEFREAIHHLD